MTAAVEIAGLHKTYRRWRKPPQHAVDGLDLDVPEGGVFGFLGPNGSGKTTTLRMMLGLARADSGELRVLGRPVPDDLPDVIGAVGALVETPLFFPTFTARRNLSLLAGAAGIADSRVSAVLDLVGLSDRAEEPVKGFSLGMKQRLGIAAALLKRPRLLVLDEPGNGLDAAGIREVRDLIRRLGADGVTVLLSSHQLNEVQQVCDRVAIMSRGRVVQQGTVSALLAARSSGELRLRIPDLPTARELLQAAGFGVRDDVTAGVAAGGAPTLRLSGVVDPGRVTELLSRAGLYLTELTPIATDLESVFLDITEHADGGTATGDGTPS